MNKFMLRRVVLDACDGPFGSAIKSEHYAEEGARVIRLGNIGTGEWRDGSKVFLAADYWQQLSSHHASAGDVVVAGLGDEGHPVGRACVVPDYIGQALVKADCYRMRLNPLLADARFIAAFLSSRAGLGQAEALAEGSTRQRLTLSKAMSIRIPQISITAQRRAADFLDAETTRIDTLIAKKRQMIQLLEARWRSAVVERVQEIGKVDGWLPLKRFVNCLDGCRIPLSAEERQFRSGPYPYFGASGQIDSVDEYLFDETLVLLGEDGAQLGDPHCEVAYVASGRIWVNNHAHVLQPVKADADFLALHLSTFDRSAFISGSTREKITQEDMNMIPVPKIDDINQRREGQEFRRLREVSRKVSETISRQIDLLREHRQALITAAVTGDLEVSERVEC